MRQYYILTIVKHQRLDYVSLQSIRQVIISIKLKIPLHFCGPEGYELDPKYKQLHYHALVSLPRGFSYKDHTSIDGFRLFYRAIADHEDLNYTTSYIEKETTNKYLLEQIQLENYY